MFEAVGRAQLIAISIRMLCWISFGVPKRFERVRKVTNMQHEWEHLQWMSNLIWVAWSQHDALLSVGSRVIFGVALWDAASGKLGGPPVEVDL